MAGWGRSGGANAVATKDDGRTKTKRQIEQEAWHAEVSSVIKGGWVIFPIRIL